MRLPDGRTLAFSEWGSSDGPTVVLCHAGHVSRPMTFGWEAAATVGMRLVCADRPGIGRSTFLSGRSILDWPGDIAALMSHLRVDRFIVAGVSAGSPYALACAVALADRVDVVGVIAGTVPPEHAEGDALAALAKTDPEAARRAIEEHHQHVAADIPASMLRVGDRPGPDGPLYRQPSIQEALIAAARESYRAGPQGPAYDGFIRSRPWGFRLADVQRPCVWWHGEADAVVPLQLVEKAATAMPACSLVVVPGVGHGINMTHTEPFLRALLERAVGA